MENKEIAPYDICDQKGGLLIAAGSSLTDAKRELLNKRRDWHIDAKPPFKFNEVMAKQYQHNYERALQRYSDLFNECVKSGKLPSSSLHILAEFVSQFNQVIPQFATMSGMGGMDYYTQSHSLNVAAICAILGYHLKLTIQEIGDLITAGLIHDIGKTKVPQKILLAKRKLTPNEFAVIQTHPEIGAGIVAGSYSPEIESAVKYHHVRIGKGYPENMEYRNLSDLVKWVGTADVFEALTAERPYRYKLDPYKAMKTLYDEGVVNSDFHFVRSFSDIFAKLFIGAVVSLSNGAFGVIKGVTEIDGVYAPLIETSSGDIIDTSDDIDIRDIIGIL